MENDTAGTCPLGTPLLSSASQEHLRVYGDELEELTRRDSPLAQYILHKQNAGHPIQQGKCDYLGDVGRNIALSASNVAELPDPIHALMSMALRLSQRQQGYDELRQTILKDGELSADEKIMLLHDVQVIEKTMSRLNRLCNYEVNALTNPTWQQYVERPRGSASAIANESGMKHQ